MKKKPKKIKPIKFKLTMFEKVITLIVSPERTGIEYLIHLLPRIIVRTWPNSKIAREFHNSFCNMTSRIRMKKINMYYFYCLPLIKWWKKNVYLL